MIGAGKKGRIFLVLLIGVCVLAVGAIYAGLQLGYYTSSNLGSVAQPAPPRLQTNGVYGVAAYPLYAPQLAPGTGRQDTAAYCNTCHTPSYITMQPPLPASAWEAEVNKMGKAFGAQIPTDAQARIIKYLQTHYTPETRKH
ncbi:MAG: sulfide dehydrogenase [Candidatus Acidiferrales bacterium]